MTVMTRSKPPNVLVDPRQIPAEMKSLDQWVLWRLSGLTVSLEVCVIGAPR